MTRFALTAVLFVALAGCERKVDPVATPEPGKPSGTQATPKPNRDGGGGKEAETPKKTRKVTHPEKKGMLATYECECNPGKTWTQPAEEEKLCLDYCSGEMPECGKLLREEAAPK